MLSRVHGYLQIAAFLLGLSQPGAAADLVVTSFTGNGEITWTFPANGVYEYRVEWASPLTSDRWTDLEPGSSAIMPTGTTTAAQVPRSFRVKALGPPPTNMVYVPAGRFDMGDTFGEGNADELPVHRVYLHGFYIDRFEVTTQLWNGVYEWALTNGYGFSNTGAGESTNHPIHTINWYDAVKWCNARSEREGLSPPYYTDPSFSSPYRTGEQSISNECVDWDASGYRLPTEAEWEKAARGSSAHQRFPWGANSISHGRANYSASGGEPYDLSNGSGNHPDYDDGSPPYTNPGQAFTANAYGLYGTAGNVAEWCWDSYKSDYYSSSPTMDPRGPGNTPYRVVRGGSWAFSAFFSRCASRLWFDPGLEYNSFGFRSVRVL